MAYEQACERRDAERNKLEQQERIAAEEADARTFIEDRAPEFAQKVNGNVFHTYAEAKAVWEQRNREEADRLKKEKTKKAKADRGAAQVGIVAPTCRVLAWRVLAGWRGRGSL